MIDLKKLNFSSLTLTSLLTLITVVLIINQNIAKAITPKIIATGKSNSPLTFLFSSYKIIGKITPTGIETIRDPKVLQAPNCALSPGSAVITDNIEP